MSCYSDHDEDIRTKGSCDFCGGIEPGHPAADELQAELGPTVRYLKAKSLPGDRPEEIGPSGIYGFRRVHPMTWETNRGPVVQVVEATNGRQWIATPARYYASHVAQGLTDCLSIDEGMGWRLSGADTADFVRFARRVMAEELWR